MPFLLQADNAPRPGNVIRHNSVVGANGRHYPTGPFLHSIRDLYHYGYITNNEANRQITVTYRYMYNGDVNVGTDFYSVYSGELVNFGQLIDDNMEMWIMAKNLGDTTDDEDDDEDVDMETDLYSGPYPTNIGMCRLYGPILIDMEPINISQVTETTEDLTESDAEDVIEMLTQE